MPKFNIHYSSKSSPTSPEVHVVWGVDRSTAEEAIRAVSADLAKDPKVHSFHIKKVEKE